MSVVAVKWSDAQLCEVVAYTPHGAVLPLAWPLPLDGLLSGVLKRRRDIEAPERPSLAALHSDPHGTRDPVVKAYRDQWRQESLPLARFAHKSMGVGAQWF